MPGFDTSNVAAEVGQGVQQPNALQTVSNLATLQNQLNQNKMFPLEYAGRALQNTGLGISNQTASQSLTNTQVGNLQGTVASIPPLPSESDTDYKTRVYSRVQAGVQAGLYSQDQANAWAGSDASAPQLRALQAQAALASQNASALKAQYGEPISIDNGQTIQQGNARVFPGGVTQTTLATGPLGTVQKAQSPTEQGQLVGYMGQDGAQHSIPKSAIQDPQGHGIPNVKDADGNPITDANGALAVTLPPSQVALLNSTATNQADRASALQTAFEGSAMRKALAQEMLEANGEFRSGPGAAHWGEIVTEANRIFGTNFAADPTTAQQVAGKIAQMMSAQQRDTLGLPATNAGQAAADIASPNTAYSPGAIQTLAGQLAGNEDLLQKKQAAWTKYSKQPGATYNGFVGQFNKTYDPRYFWDQYVPDQQKATANMTPTEKAAYQQQEQRAMALKF